MRPYVVRILLASALCVGLLFAGCTFSQNKEPVTIDIWTYYNNNQLSAFRNLVDAFNSTRGAEKGIYVETSNMGSVEDLRDAVMRSAREEVGAKPLPNIFLAYPDTVYTIDQMGLVVDLEPYFSLEERQAYVEGYLEEGSLGKEDSIKILPTAKSVELLSVNKTDFDQFAQATGASYEDLATYEGLTRTAQRYYEWTDAQTEKPYDGKAFFGRDALANYFYIGAKQLGTTIVTYENGQVSLDFNKETIRTLWDNYYLPFVKGYFDAKGRYRSDNIKTGDIIAMIGSSSGATFFPATVIEADGTERKVESLVLPCPHFEGCQPISVQQGAGMTVIKSSEEEIQACLEFLKWFSAPEQNIRFSVSSGYLPVMNEANNMEAIRSITPDLDMRMEKILETSMAETKKELYTPHAFENGASARSILEHSLSDLAAADAATVRKSLESGKTFEEALAPFVTDEYFDAWYEETKAQLEALF